MLIYVRKGCSNVTVTLSWHKFGPLGAGIVRGQSVLSASRLCKALGWVARGTGSA